MVGSIRIEAQAHRNRLNNPIVTGLITEDDFIAVCDIAKEIGVTLTDTSFNTPELGKVNKHLVRFKDRKIKFEIHRNVEGTKSTLW